MVEDNLDNLKSAKRLGLTTVWISRAAHKPAYVDYRFRSVLQLARLDRVFPMFATLEAAQAQ